MARTNKELKSKEYLQLPDIYDNQTVQPTPKVVAG